MKKLYRTLKAKKYNKKCQRRELKKKKRIHQYKKEKRTPEYREKIEQKKIKTENIKFPTNFSFIKNTSELLEYFYQAGKYFKEKKNVNFDLSQVTAVTPDAVALYSALHTDEKFVKKQFFTGNLPKDDNLKLVFIKSGFFNYVNSKVPKNINTEITEIEKNKKVNTKIAKKCAEKITPKNKPKYDFLYKILIELMANTNNHADPKQKAKHHWCLQVYYDDIDKIYKCTFVDVGVGIFESTIIKDYKEKSMLLFSEKNDSLFKKILNGKIKGDNKLFTRTKQQNRGKGLPLVYKLIKQNKQFSKSIIISNDVYALIKDGNLEEKYTILNINFSGTFYYWEIK